MAKLIDENVEPGCYKITFDGSHLSSGTYFYTLKAVDFVPTKKMLIVK